MLKVMFESSIDMTPFNEWWKNLEQGDRDRLWRNTEILEIFEAGRNSTLQHSVPDVQKAILEQSDRERVAHGGVWIKTSDHTLGWSYTPKENQ